MDELRIYDRALSDAEIKLLYEVKLSAITPIPIPGTVPSQIPVTLPDAPGKLSELKPTTPGLPEAPNITIVLQIDNPKMYVNGVEKEIDPGYGTKPIILNGKTVLPIRAIIESLGGKLGWDQAEQRIALDVNDTTIIMWIDRQEYYVNGVRQTLDVAPVVVNTRTLLPLRALLESLGYVVEWNVEHNAIIIVSTN